MMIRDVQNATCRYYGIELREMISDCRERRLARPRQVAAYLARHLTDETYPKIGWAFRRDHSTIVHAVAQIGNLIDRDTEIGRDVARIRAILNSAGPVEREAQSRAAVAKFGLIW